MTIPASQKLKMFFFVHVVPCASGCMDTLLALLESARQRRQIVEGVLEMLSRCRLSIEDENDRRY